MRMRPRITAFSAKSYLPVPSPTNWNVEEIWGRMICHAIATAATVTIDAISMIQPANQDTTWLEICFDHW